MKISMTRYEKIKEVLDNMDTAELVNIHNSYCNASQHMDDHIYNMEEFDEIMADSSPLNVVQTCYNGDFRPFDDYFCFNNCANVVSFDSWEEENCPIDTSGIAHYIDDNNTALNCIEIHGILSVEC